MEEQNYKAKCVKCGYIFEADESKTENKCPLCGTLNDTKEATSGFKEKFKDYLPEKKSKKRTIIDLLLIGAAFAAFIIVLYLLVGLILGVANVQL